MSEHRYARVAQSYNALLTSPDAAPPPMAFHAAFTKATVPELKAASNAVFFAGRMYENAEISPDGGIAYEHLDPWRDTVKAAIGEHVIYLDGAGDLTPEASAGKALLNLLVSRICVVYINGGRIGPATHHEAAVALASGADVGIITRAEEYDDTVAFLEGRTGSCPPNLPLWWGTSLRPKDVIRGVEALPEWLDERLGMVNPGAFRGRTIDVASVGLMMHYAGHLQNDPEQLSALERIAFGT